MIGIAWPMRISPLSHNVPFYYRAACISFLHIHYTALPYNTVLRCKMATQLKKHTLIFLQVLVIGAGPCGLRMAIESALLGARTVVVEMRDYVSRNNVLHLWPFVISDLKALGGRVFHNRFCSGAREHASKHHTYLITQVAMFILSFQSLIC